MACVRPLRMWIEDYKKNLKSSNTTTTVTQILRPNNVISTPPSHIIPPGVVMATSIAPPTGNVPLPSVDYSVSDIIFDQPPRYPSHLSPTVVNARPPLLPYVRPGCFIHTAGNQYMAATGVYTHQWGATPLLAPPQSHPTPQSHLIPQSHPTPRSYPLLLSPRRTVLLPRHPMHPTFQQPHPYTIQVRQYPPPATHPPLLLGQDLVEHTNTSSKSCELMMYTHFFHA